jgi:hypothetical protein
LVEHALAAHDLMGNDPEIDGARQILKWIRRKRRTCFSKRDAFVGLRSVFQRADRVDGPLQLLAAHEYIRALDTPLPEGGRRNRGRPPSPRFEVNPFTHNAQNPQNPTDLGESDG